VRFYDFQQHGARGIDADSYSVGTRRKSVIGRAQIDRCRDILASDSATNFEMRMVAEVQLYWILYENCCLGDVDLPKAQSALQQWRQTWKLVLGLCETSD
jgi:hypothetical protein